MEQSAILQYVKSLNARRKKRRLYGWGSFLLGLGTIFNAGQRFPIPVIGLWALLFGVPLVIMGVGLLSSSYKLPMREALLFASLQNGKLTAPTLSMGLDIDLETAELILDQLVRKGYAQISIEDEDTEEGIFVYKINGVKKFEKEISSS